VSLELILFFLGKAKTKGRNIMNTNIFSTVLLFSSLTGSMSSFAQEVHQDNPEMKEVIEALEVVGEKCINFALVSIQDVKESLDEEKIGVISEEKQNDFYISTYYSAVRACLQAGAFKLNKAAELIKQE